MINQFSKEMISSVLQCSSLVYKANDCKINLADQAIIGERFLLSKNVISARLLQFASSLQVLYYAEEY